MTDGARLDAVTTSLELVVVGAHLQGMPLNHELTSLGAVFLREDKTAPDYRLFALPGTSPRKPGVLRVAAGTGQALDVEVWSLEAAAFGRFVAAIPSPLGIGKLRLESGQFVSGFLCESVAVDGAEDISSFGGWRSYQRSQLETS